MSLTVTNAPMFCPCFPGVSRKVAQTVCKISKLIQYCTLTNKLCPIQGISPIQPLVKKCYWEPQPMTGGRRAQKLP